MRLITIAAVVLAIAGSAYGQSKDVQVPFLFTQDESLPSTDVQRNAGSGHHPNGRLPDGTDHTS
jgi:hypothetical protein